MSFFFAVAAATVVLAQSEAGTTPVQDLTPRELSAMLGRGHLCVIDVNEEDNYSAAHVPGAKRMDYDAITADALPADRSDTLVFYCWSAECPAASLAAQAASLLRYTDVHCMRAGITGWQDDGLPTEP
jgi:rhodanese-related sulfurtransferase